MNEIGYEDIAAAPAATAPAFRPARRQTRLAQALNDLAQGAARWWIWSNMAWEDIRLRYRGSILGPFWLTLSMAVMIATLGIVYSTIFKAKIHAYLPFLTLGLILWTFASTVVGEGCNCFISAEPIIRQVRMPFTTHVLRVLARNLIVLGHNAVVYLAVALWFTVPLDARALLALPGLLIEIANGVWMCLLLGMLSARFRDIVPIVASAIQIVFFTTPILWFPDLLNGHYRWIVDFNPVYAMIEIVRAPLLGQPVSAGLWALALAVTLLGWALALAAFARFRARIPFWV
ncbi:MAG TPA: ABC transporter permease [Stellaceae bacterium]|nr:ABC transporter permease [Stellaceae bacterium]